MRGRRREFVEHPREAEYMVFDCPWCDTNHAGDCMPEEDHREDRDREYDWMEGMEPDTKED